MRLIRLFSILIIIVVFSGLIIAEDKIDLNGTAYLAMVTVNDQGEPATKGNVQVPYWLQFVHDPQSSRAAGALLKTEYVFDGSDTMLGFTVVRDALEKAIVKNSNRVKFNLLSTDGSSQKNLIAKIRNSGKKIILNYPGENGKKIKLIFERIDYERTGIYYNKKLKGTITASPENSLPSTILNNMVIISILNQADNAPENFKLWSFWLAAAQGKTPPELDKGKGTPLDANSYYTNTDKGSGMYTFNQNRSVTVDHTVWGKNGGSDKTYKGKVYEFGGVNYKQTKRHYNVVLLVDKKIGNGRRQVVAKVQNMKGWSPQADLQYNDKFFGDKGYVEAAVYDSDKKVVLIYFNVPDDMEGKYTFQFGFPWLTSSENSNIDVWF